MLQQYKGARWTALCAIPFALACGSSRKSTPQVSPGSGGLDDSGAASGASGNGGTTDPLGIGGVSAGTSGQPGAAGTASDGGTFGHGGTSGGGLAGNGVTGGGAPGGAAGTTGSPPLPPALTFTAESSAASLINGIWGSAADDVYAVGDGGDIVHSTGDGTWKQQMIDTGSRLTGVWGSGNGDIYVSVFSNFLLHSTGDGKWQHQTTALGEVFRDIWGPSATQIYALVGGGVDVSSGDGNWRNYVTITASAYTTAIWGASASDVFVATNYSDAPTVYRLSASGDWTGDRGSPKVSLADITGSDPNHLYAIGADTVFSSHGDGNWKPELVVTGAIVQAVWAASSGAVYACTSKGTFYRSNGAGVWSDPQIIDPAKGSVLQCRCIWGSDVNNIYIGTPGAGIYHSTK